MTVMQKMDQWLFSYIGPSHFVFMAIFFSIIGDASYLIFLKFALASEENLKIWMHQYSWMPNMKLILNNPELMTQMQNDFQRMLQFLISIVIFLNLIGYFYFYFQKKFAIKYIKNLAFSGLLLGFFAAWEAYEHGIMWTLIMLGTMPLYYITYRGIKFYYNIQLSS